MFKGSFVALVTPFRDGKVDEKTLHALLDFHLKNHTDGIVPCGTTGESATMSHDEHKRILSLVVEHVAGRVPVICGAGSNCTQEALGLIQHAKAIKAQGVLVVTPYYNRPTQEGLFRHYEFLAKKVDIPFVIYNVPARTGVSIAPDTVARLARLKNIVAIKEASGSLEQVSQILNLCNITVLSGDDPLTVPMIAIGAQGVISVTANVVPRLVHDMTQAALDGNFEKAKKIHYDLLDLSKCLFLETNPIPVKYALKQMGKISGELRLPLCEMSKPNADKLRDAMRQLKLVS
jgi:4-hydroxy-tetrahydrodipicolinate synthase